MGNTFEYYFLLDYRYRLSASDTCQWVSLAALGMLWQNSTLMLRHWTRWCRRRWPMRSVVDLDPFHSRTSWLILPRGAYPVERDQRVDCVDVSFDVILNRHVGHRLMVIAWMLLRTDSKIFGKRRQDLFDLNHRHWYPTVSHLAATQWTMPSTKR